MAEKRIDPRTEKTRRAIREAFAELLTEKELHKITVQEISDKAEINRVTFYKHYLDIYDLYDKLEADTLVELGLLVLELESLSHEEFYAQLIGYISKNRSVFTMIFNPNATGQLRSKVDKLIEGLFRKMQSEKMTVKLSNKELEYLSCYRAQGCLAIIARWVNGGFAEPEERMVKMAAMVDKNTEKLFQK